MYFCFVRVEVLVNFMAERLIIEFYIVSSRIIQLKVVAG